MKSVITGLLMPFILLSPGVHAQETAHWEAYVLNYEKGPGSVLLDVNLKQLAPVKTHPYLLITGVTFKNCTPDRLPQQKEFPHLYEISKTIRTEMEQMGVATLAGTYTYQCQRLDYYYLSDTTGVREQLNKLYRRHFKHYPASVEITQDSTWEVYNDFLYPSDEVFEFMRNQPVVAQLQSNGDSLTAERRVDHMLYFTTAEDRTNFINYAQNARFKVEHLNFIKAEEKPYQLQISRTDKVDINSISKVTAELRKQARIDNGAYDGWETSIILF